MKAKICGITRLEDALLAIQHGAFALGFNFYPASPRYIEPLQAKKIIQALPEAVITVGIFIQNSALLIQETMQNVGLHLAQVYEDLNCDPLFKQRLILSLNAATAQDLPSHTVLHQYGYLLLDASPARVPDGLLGGTGRICNWDLAQQLAKQYRLILAGGLNPHNVELALHTVQPFAVDVASGIETTPGIKNPTLMLSFLRRITHAH